MTAAILPLPPAPQHAPGRTRDLRAIKVVWQREMLAFLSSRLRFVATLMQPILMLYVLGTGLSTLTNKTTGGVDLRTFLFPGVLTTSVVFTAVFSSMSIVWDREFGFLREMLVAPVSRASIIIGKAIAGATVATVQSIVILVLAPTVGVPYAPVMMGIVLVQLFLVAFALTALGLVMAARIKRMQSMMGLMQTLVVPLSFLSGSLYPIAGLPLWLKTLTLINPITYAVHAVRTTVFAHVDAPAAALGALNPPITWWGWELPSWFCLALVVAIGFALLAVAVRSFSRVD